MLSFKTGKTGALNAVATNTPVSNVARMTDGLWIMTKTIALAVLL